MRNVRFCPTAADSPNVAQIDVEMQGVHSDALLWLCHRAVKNRCWSTLSTKCLLRYIGLAGCRAEAYRLATAPCLAGASCLAVAVHSTVCSHKVMQLSFDGGCGRAVRLSL